MTTRRAWLTDKIATGRRAAQPGRCPRCGTSTLTGPDHDTNALDVTVDAEPVAPYLYALWPGNELHRQTTITSFHIEHECRGKA